MIDSEQTVFSDDQTRTITCRLNQTNATAFFVNSNTGVIYGKFEDDLDPGNCTIDLVATEESGQTDTVETYTFRVAEKDGLKSRELQVNAADSTSLKSLGGGEGCFGEVWKGLLNNGVAPEYMVAANIAKVKEGRDMTERTAAAESDLMEEALLMAQVEPHINLVLIIGVMTRGQPKPLVLCFCEHGALSGMLQKRASDGVAFPLAVKHRFCAEIAAGMVSTCTCCRLCGGHHTTLDPCTNYLHVVLFALTKYPHTAAGPPWRA